MSKAKASGIRILLLAGDRYGANCFMEGQKLCILDKFKSYGWSVTLAGVAPAVPPCPFAAGKGAVPVSMDCTIDDVPDASSFDAISILPGPSHQGLVTSSHAMALIRDAVDRGLVISAWCRGVRVLAAADVIRGKRIVGHSDDRELIEQAGAVFVGHDHPPVTDGRLVTGARSYYYRAKNAEAIRAAVLAERSRRVS